MRRTLLKLILLSITLAACATQPAAANTPQSTRTPPPDLSNLSVPTTISTLPATQQTIKNASPPATPTQPTAAAGTIPPVIDGLNASLITQTKKIELSPWELIHALDWSPDGVYLAVAAGGSIFIYSSADYGKVLSLKPGIWSPGIDFSPDGRLIAAGGRDGVLRIWDAQSGDQMMAFEAHKKGVNSVAFHPDGQLLASGGNDAMARLWGISTGEEWGQMIGGTFSIPAIAFTVDGSSLALANGDIIRLRDVNDQRFVSTLRGENSFYSLSLSPDGGKAAAGDTAGDVYIWQLASENPSHKFTNQKTGIADASNLVWEVAFSPDGDLIASANGNGSIYLWEVGSGDLLASLPGHTLAVSAISFSPDGRTLASGGLDGVIYVWQVTAK